jgi:hypothetical protein
MLPPAKLLMRGLLLPLKFDLLSFWKRDWIILEFERGPSELDFAIRFFLEDDFMLGL